MSQFPRPLVTVMLSSTAFRILVFFYCCCSFLSSSLRQSICLLACSVRARAHAKSFSKWNTKFRRDTSSVTICTMAGMALVDHSAADNMHYAHVALTRITKTRPDATRGGCEIKRRPSSITAVKRSPFLLCHLKTRALGNAKKQTLLFGIELRLALRWRVND